MKFLELDWHEEFQVSQRNVVGRPSPVLDSLWPMCTDYFSALNPVFLTKVGSEVEKLKKNQQWLSRDGLFPGLWFLYNTSPQRIKGKILFHTSFDSYVPDAWRNRVDLYRIESEVKKSQPSNVVLAGILSGTNMDYDDFLAELDEFERALQNVKAHGMPIYAYLPCRGTVYPMDDKLMGRAIKEMLKRFGKDLHFIDLRFFRYRSSFQDCYFYELNPRWLYSDGFLLHTALSKGASLLEAECKGLSKTRRKETIALSPYHSVGIYSLSKKKGKELSPKDLEKLLYLNRFSTGLRTSESWPEGFSRLIKFHRELSS